MLSPLKMSVVNFHIIFIIVYDNIISKTTTFFWMLIVSIMTRDM